VSTPPLSLADTPPLIATALSPADAVVTAVPIFPDARSRFFDVASDDRVQKLLWERFAEHCAAIVDSSLHVDTQHVSTQDAADPASIAPQRHQSLVRRAQAYFLSRDPQHAEACLSMMESWLASAGRTEAAGSEPGFRLISWCWVLVLLHDAEALTTVRLSVIAEAIRSHAASQLVAPRQPASPATQITVNALALFYVAVLFPDFPESERWRELATHVLVSECARQVHPDGVHFEQSTCFQRYVTDVYLHFLVLAARSGFDVPPIVSERVQRMLEFVLAIRMPDGTVPSIGDSDGGSLLPLTHRSTADPRGRFAVAAALFGRPDFAWAADGSAPDVAWLLGLDGMRSFDAVRPAPPSAAPSRAFPSGGYAVMRTGWDRDAHQMIVDVGAIGCPVSGAHGHADLLSLQCSVFGEPVIVDPGTHCYGDSRWRDFFRSTAAHSTILVDGVSQAEPAGSFGWHRRPRVRLREWHSTADVDFLDAEHDGYESLPEPVHHRRRVIFIKRADGGQGKLGDAAQPAPAYWIVVDDLSGTGRHEIDLTFQFASANVAMGTHPWARVGTPHGRCLWISAFPSAPAQSALKCGAPAPIRGWISPEFTRLSPAPMLIYRFAVALPWRIVTLLLPDRQGLSAPPGVRPVYDAGGLPHGFVFDRPRRLVRFDDRAVVVERD